MRFIYGKQDWKTMERGQENCYLLTNGLGGFSSSTMIGSSSRNDHAFFMACIQAPNHRYHMIHRLEEVLSWKEKRVHLSSQEYEDAQKNEEGYRYLSEFSFEDEPQWIYHVEGIEVVKRIGMQQGENTVSVEYFVENRTGNTVQLKVIPHLQFTRKGAGLSGEEQFECKEKPVVKDGYECNEEPKEYSITSSGLQMFFRTNGQIMNFPLRFCEGLYYAYDARDGRNCIGRTAVNHWVCQKIPPHSKGTLEIVYSMEPVTRTAEQMIKEGKQYRKALVKKAGMHSEAASMLVRSANQFIARRESTNGKTILAGFPFFEDWGRDTMIALAGCCISTRQYEDARSILRTFSRYCKDGLMPNLFPEGENQPYYNTVDAALLFINAVYLYYKKSGDLELVDEMWNCMTEIIKHYEKGTHYGIHMDSDGLIMAGQGLDQVTWMDVRVGEILPTPRHGKPVEINAYWYNALCIMQEFGKLLEKDADHYQQRSLQVKESFCHKFWNEEKHCLRDVISSTKAGSIKGDAMKNSEIKPGDFDNNMTKADDQIRCNQIWAISMPYTMLEAEQEKQVVDTVFEKLYTPYGLRTLDMEDREFKPEYSGTQLKRDLSYHQGTVWTFPLGAYYLAYLKVEGYSAEAKETVKRQLEVMESAMREGCIGQLPEIYDGENPTSSRGCFAQAWSVGEILRVYEVLES